MVIRILLVDDEPTLLEITQYFLERDTQLTTETAPSGDIALELLETGSYDVIVSDYEMPGMDGLELLSRIRERDITIPFIIQTGRGREEVVIKALNLGADFYLQKGGDPDSQFAELKSKIIHAIEKKKAEERARTSYEEMKNALNILEEQNRRLEESEAKFRNLADSTSVAILIHQDNRWIYANPAAERMTGYSTEEICELDFWEFVAPEYQQVVKERGQLRGDGKEAENSYEFMILNKSGEEVWVKIVGSTTKYQGRLAVMVSVIDLTERKHMEETLRKQEEDYRTLLNCLSDIILVINGEDTFTAVHHNKNKLYVPPEDFLGKHFRDVLPAYIYEQYSNAAALLRKTGEPQVFDYPIEIDGETMWFEALLNLREDGVSIIAVIRDLTERKQAEDVIRGNEAQYRTLVENIPIALVQADANGEIVYVNQQTLDILGLPAREAIGEINLLDFPPLLKSGISGDIRTAMTERRTIVAERGYVNKDGSESCIGYRIAPLDTGGEVTGILASIESLTTNWHAE